VIWGIDPLNAFVPSVDGVCARGRSALAVQRREMAADIHCHARRRVTEARSDVFGERPAIIAIEAYV